VYVFARHWVVGRDGGQMRFEMEMIDRHVGDKMDGKRGPCLCDGNMTPFVSVQVSVRCMCNRLAA
jgi:hypothetical protein